MTETEAGPETNDERQIDEVIEMGARPKQDETWVMGDPHFGHERIIELCDRPFRKGGEPDVTAMNMAIIDNINAFVRPRHHLIILGDTIMGKFEETVQLLKLIKAGRITIIPGNHDRFSLAYQHAGGRDAQAARRLIWKGQYEAVRKGVTCFEDRLPSAWRYSIGGTRVLMSHYPYAGDSQFEEVEVNGQMVRRSKDRHARLRPRDEGLPLVHGHVHGAWQRQERMLNVGVDVWDFKPVGISLIRDWAMALEPPVGYLRARASRVG
jgi:calcineurin-like phosphoesterase family protein